MNGIDYSSIIYQCEMDTETVETLWTGAFRYYLGRKSYAVGVFCRSLIKEWSSLPESLQRFIQRELEEAFQKDDLERESGKTTFLTLGMDCDRKDWEKVRKLYKFDK